MRQPIWLGRPAHATRARFVWQLEAIHHPIARLTFRTRVGWLTWRRAQTGVYIGRDPPQSSPRRNRVLPADIAMPKKNGGRPLKSARDDMFSAVASIRRIVRVLRLASQQTQSAAGIGAAQLFVLQQLGDGAELSLNELAERTLTDRSSVAAVVERLQAQKLVGRTTDPSDRRRAVIRITAT